MTGALLEREEELGRAEAVLDRAAAGGGLALLVEGHAGSGKTTLLRAVGERAAARGFRVLRARGSELARPLGFGVARELLRPAAASFAGPAAAARDVLAEAPPAEPQRELRALHGLTWMVAQLADEQPLLLAVDDVHWADTPSLRWLVLLAGRLAEMPTALVAAARSAEPGADEDLLDALAVDAATEVVHPSPLSAAAVGQLVGGALGRPAAPAFCAACHRATAGNPLLLRELLAELRGAGVRPTAGDAERVPAFGPERVARSVRRRLRRVGPEALAVARAAAVLGPGAALDDVVAVAGVDPEAGRAAAERLCGLGVLAAGPAVEWVHPIVRAAVYEDVPGFERQRLHGEAARRIVAAGTGGERAALHLLGTAPAGDPATVALLRGAAREARSRGAPGTAARYLERALAEPPSAGRRAAVLRELGAAEATGSRREGFEPHLRAALAATADAEERARIALDLGRGLGGCGAFGEAVEVFDAALADLGEAESPLAVALLGELLTMGVNDFTSLEIAVPHLRRALDGYRAGRTLAPEVLGPVALSLVSRSPPADRALAAVDLIRRSGVATDEADSMLAACVGNTLIYAGRPGEAARFYDAVIDHARGRGSRLTLGWANVMRANASLQLGLLERAAEEAREGLALLGAGAGGAGRAWSCGHEIAALVARGDLDAADAALADTGALAAPPSFARAVLLTSVGRLRRAQERPAEALDALAECAGLLGGDIDEPERVGGRVGRDNPAQSAWRSEAAHACAALGRREHAARLAAAELAAAQAFAIPAAVGTALRAVGLAQGSVPALRASVAELERGEARLEHARSLVELGAALRRAGERAEAREVLREALDRSTRIGAVPLADRAHDELVTAGARPRRDRRLLRGPAALTASEARVAALAAEGLTNREIAGRLVVSVKAVEFHLGHVYAKLGVASRAELPAALQDETLGALP